MISDLIRLDLVKLTNQELASFALVEYQEARRAAMTGDVEGRIEHLREMDRIAVALKD